MGVAPGRLAAAGGNWGMRGGEASPHPSTAYVPCQLKKGTVNELLALRATGPWGVRLLRARGVSRACPRDAAYRGSVPQPEGGTSGHRHRAGLVLRGLRATRGSGGHARVDVKTVRSLLPPSQPPPRWGEEPGSLPPLGGGAGFPPPAGRGAADSLPQRGRAGEGAVTFVATYCRSSRGIGETGFPHTSARGRVWEGAALQRTTFFHPVGMRRSRTDGYRATGCRRR